MLPGASGRRGIGGTLGAPGGFNLPPRRDWRAPFGAAHPGRADATQPPGSDFTLPPDNRHPARRHGAPAGGAGDDAMAANPAFGPNQTDWRRPGPGLRHAPASAGYGNQARAGAASNNVSEDSASYGGPRDRYGKPQKPANEWGEGQYPGETPWHPIASQYRNVRPEQPPPYIRDVDIDYNWFCYSEDTQVLTERGWVFFKELTDDDLVATRNPESREIEYQKPSRRPVYDYDGEMYHFHSRAVDILVTPEHRMLVDSLPDKAARKLGLSARGGHRKQEVILSAKLLSETATSSTRIPVCASWRGRRIQERVVAGDHHLGAETRLSGDEYCAFMGLYLSTGCVEYMGGRPWRVKIAQSPRSSRLGRIRQDLERMFVYRAGYKSCGNASGGGFFIHSAALARLCEQFGEAHEKFIPDDILNAPPDQLRIFWEAFTLGNGTHSKHASNRGHPGRAGGVTHRIKTASPRLADQLQEVALKLGYLATVAAERRGRRLIWQRNRASYVSPKRGAYRISLYSATKLRFAVERVRYQGKVYCVTVPNGIVAVRRCPKAAPDGACRRATHRQAQAQRCGREAGATRLKRRAYRASGWLWCGNSPFQPVWPFGPPYVTYPREWDYPVGINLEYQPRRMGLYAMLRAMSYGWGILRAVIETRKDQLMRIPWDIRLINASAKSSARDRRVQQLKEFFKKPDRKHRWQTWCRLILEDLLVIDAPALYIWRSQAGTPYALECLDGSTIKVLIDDAGRVPDPPSPAYQQVIKGLPMVDFRADEIIYAPMRPRPELPIYGYSPVEQCFLEITEGIRRTLYQLDYWSEGSVPDLIVTVPDGWTPAQISQFQAYTDALLGGNLHQKSKIRFLPGGMRPFDIKSAGGELLKSDYDEWLARIICFAFSISPQGFVKMMNRATAESSDQAAKEEGLYPLMTYFESEIMNPLIQEHFGYSDIEFKFMPRPEVDALKQAQALQIYVQSGVISVEEARTQLGLPKLAAKSAP